MHSCFLKCAYLVTPCTICFLLSVFVLTCVLEDTIFSCLIIVLHCIKDPLLFVHYLNLFNLFNCIELLTSYAMSLFSCAFVASIITYLLTYLLTFDAAMKHVTSNVRALDWVRAQATSPFCRWSNASSTTLCSMLEANPLPILELQSGRFVPESLSKCGN